MGVKQLDTGHERSIPRSADAPVEMPELPSRVQVDTVEKYKALADPTRTRILGIIQNEPATAKQIAERLKIAPGTAAHHLHVLEDAGLAKVVALRQVRGITAKYYTRTARIFEYVPLESVTDEERNADMIVTHVRDEVAEALRDFGPDAILGDGLARVRLSPEHFIRFVAQMSALFDAFSNEPPDPDGQVYSLGYALFRSPAYLQRPNSTPPAAAEGAKGAKDREP
jgi:DNA-binding transcriptional ArsR family regulator